MLLSDHFWHHSLKIKYVFNINVLSVFKPWCFTAFLRVISHSRPSFYSFILCALQQRVFALLKSLYNAVLSGILLKYMFRFLLSLKIHTWIGSMSGRWVYITLACFSRSACLSPFSYVVSWCWEKVTDSSWLFAQTWVLTLISQLTWIWISDSNT